MSHRRFPLFPEKGFYPKDCNEISQFMQFDGQIERLEVRRFDVYCVPRYYKLMFPFAQYIPDGVYFFSARR